MKTLLLGWRHLRRVEKLALIVATTISICLAYSATRNGLSITSAETLGPLVLMVFVIQSTLMTGIMRFRSFAMNHILVEALSELREVRANPGMPVPTVAMDLVARFLGDKK